VEQPDDYAFAAAIYDALYSVKPAFTHDDIRALLASRPDLRTYGGARRA
jgi:spore coat polysaccharide biosynthesis protein SpsF